MREIKRIAFIACLSAVTGGAAGYLGAELAKPTTVSSPPEAGVTKHFVDLDDKVLMQSEQIKKLSDIAIGTERWRRDADKKIYQLMERSK